MICCARTLPTPGMHCSNALTFIFPITSLTWPSRSTWIGDAPECRIRFLISARSRRAAAALSRAAARCSGVNEGSGTVSPVPCVVLGPEPNQTPPRQQTPTGSASLATLRGRGSRRIRTYDEGATLLGQAFSSMLQLSFACWVIAFVASVILPASEASSPAFAGSPSQMVTGIAAEQ